MNDHLKNIIKQSLVEKSKVVNVLSTLDEARKKEKRHKDPVKDKARTDAIADSGFPRREPEKDRREPEKDGREPERDRGRSSGSDKPARWDPTKIKSSPSQAGPPGGTVADRFFRQLAATGGGLAPATTSQQTAPAPKKTQTTRKNITRTRDLRRRAGKKELATGVSRKNASTEIIRNSRMTLAEKVLEGFTTGDSPTQTGARAGRFMSTLKKSDASPEEIQGKRDQYRRIQRKASARQAQHGFHRGETPGEQEHRRASSMKRFEKGYLQGTSDSTEIIRNSRIALAEKVLSALSEDREKGRRATLGRSDVISANHPEYVRGKLYQRGTKEGGYGKEGTTTAPMTTGEINRTGVKGHKWQAFVAKKRGEKTERAQKISNKLRARRGLIPLSPGETHDPKSDKIGKSEN